MIIRVKYVARSACTRVCNNLVSFVTSFRRYTVVHAARHRIQEEHYGDSSKCLDCSQPVAWITVLCREDGVGILRVLIRSLSSSIWLSKLRSMGSGA